MHRYETLFVTVPELSAEEATALTTALEQSITTAGGTMISCERWGKYHLAYPIKKHEYGIYYLVRFEAPAPQHQEMLAQVKALLTVKHGDIVLRSLNTVLSPKVSLAYQRPESLEDAPRADRTAAYERIDEENPLLGADLADVGFDSHLV